MIIEASCPLGHKHKLEMSESFRDWIAARTSETTSVSGFAITLCPWGVRLEPKSSERCPSCGMPYGFKRGFCCAFPLED